MGNNKLFKDLGYKVTSTYDWRVLNGTKEFHPGVDLVTTPHGAIEAFTEGKVIWAGEGVSGSGYGGYGTVVAVKDKNAKVHVYGHLSKVAVHKGDSVKKGQVIGNQGNSGHSFGEHLHYEIRKQEAYVADREKRCHVPDEYLERYYGTVDAEFEEVKKKPEAKPEKSEPKKETKHETHKVKPGDSLSKIAKENDTTVDKLMKLNPEIKDANKISVGQQIRVK